MASQLERLRRLQGLREQRKRDDPPVPAPRPPARDGQAEAWGALEELVPGHQVENSGGICYLHQVSFPLDDLRGDRPLATLLQRSPAALAPFHPHFGLERVDDFLDAAFIDTETTGLGGGAGIYAFMVGVGTFEQLDDAHAAGADPTHFVVRQFFMRNPAEEGALLVALAELLNQRRMTVTFNGRGFDLPLLRTRFQQNHWLFPAGVAEEAALLAPDRPHLDLLAPARRLWRRRLQSCRLINLEAQVLGLERGQEDVPGHEIPALYVAYMRDGNAAPMSRVFYHNREDIVSMVSLAEILSRTFDHGEDNRQDDALQGEELLSLGKVYEQRGDMAQAEAVYRAACERLVQPQDRAEAFARLGALLKRQERWTDATAVWQQWLSSVPGADPTPYVELAKYCEWQIRDLEQAEMWAGWALHTVQDAARGRPAPGVAADLEHRLARIRRKRAGAGR